MKMKMLILFFALHAHALIHTSQENDVELQRLIAMIDIMDLQLPRPQTLQTSENIKFLKENAPSNITNPSDTVHESFTNICKQVELRPIEILDDATQTQIARIMLDKMKSQETIDAEKEKFDSFKYIIEFRDQLKNAHEDSELIAQLKEEKSKIAGQKFNKIIENEIGIHDSAQFAISMQIQGLIRAWEKRREIFEYSNTCANIEYNYKHASSPEEQNARLEEYVQLNKNKPNLDAFEELVMTETHNSMRRILG